MPINANAFCGFLSHPYIRHCLAMLNVSRVARKTMLLRVQSRASGFLQFLNSLKSTREEPRPPNSTENERYPLTLNTHHHSSLLTSSPSLLFSTLSTPPSLFSSALPHPALSSPPPSPYPLSQVSTPRTEPGKYLLRDMSEDHLSRVCAVGRRGKRPSQMS